ncbi:MAG: PHP domain-containing protein [Longimicrobiales bacterium]|nr:PHP domain-containing protein [Longimicrobiales bacterium]
MKVDLHIHTSASDGAWSAEAVVQGAASGGLDVIAIADHDTTASFSVAEAVGSEVRVQVIPAIEVSSMYHGRSIHILGYFVDPVSEVLLNHRVRATKHREIRMREMLNRLTEAGILVTYQDVKAEAGPDGGVLGRPHLAKALVKAGHAASVPDAFNSLIGDESQFFVPTDLLEATEAVQLILASGGIPVWAHPPRDIVDVLLPELISSGLQGIEVYRPSHRPKDVMRLEAICSEKGLLCSGGSDWHSPDAGRSLGDFFVGAVEVEDLFRLGGV